MCRYPVKRKLLFVLWWQPACCELILIVHLLMILTYSQPTSDTACSAARIALLPLATDTRDPICLFYKHWAPYNRLTVRQGRSPISKFGLCKRSRFCVSNLMANLNCIVLKSDSALLLQICRSCFHCTDTFVPWSRRDTAAYAHISRTHPLRRGLRVLRRIVPVSIGWGILVARRYQGLLASRKTLVLCDEERTIEGLREETKVMNKKLEV